ncbi:hypothetical protein GOQ27_05500 [Clostridium sp. D2Q-11]|uniref:DUF5673 domain-containing protein n=1 Tax=Anaeromonas frigoriresistens TaxID=2683708 RepID=A0A942Z5X8_9FIRM|nr:hypothetical protein [Anaeromonas frigoriresistens]MBS4537906.1 hypothetical protein [Anaeromonas frigoriresistens]
MESTYFVLTFLVLVFAVVSFLKDRANTKLGGKVLYKGRKEGKTVTIIKWILFSIAIIYILYGAYNAVKGGSIMAGMDIGVFIAVYFIFFANYYTKPLMLVEEGVVKYNSFIRWKHIKGYEFKDTNGEKYKLILRYKRPSEMKIKKLIIDVYNKEEITKVLKDKVIRTKV